jgi:hypothetical protein
MKATFSKAFDNILSHRMISAHEKVLALGLSLLWIESGRPEELRITWDKLRERFGMAKVTVQKGLAALVQHRLIEQTGRGCYKLLPLLLTGSMPEVGANNYVLCKVDLGEIERFLKDKCPCLPSVETFLVSLRGLLNDPKYSRISTADVLDVLKTTNRAFAVNPKHPDYPKRGVIAYIVGAFRNKLSTPALAAEPPKQRNSLASKPVTAETPQYRTIDPDVAYCVGELNANRSIRADLLPLDRLESLVNQGYLAWDGQLLTPTENTVYTPSADGRGITAVPRDYAERHGIKVTP